jgi:hypothetical protein
MLSTSKLRGDELHIEFIMAMADGWDETKELATKI